MSVPLLGASIFIAGILAFLFFRIFKKTYPHLHPVFGLTLFVVPFAAGGFATWTAAPLSGLLLLYLYQQIRQAGYCKITFNLSSVSLLAIFAAFAITPLWAADKGMAVLGFVRFLPVLLFSIILMQLPSEQPQAAWLLVPLCGVIMTLFCFGLQFLPSLHSQLTVSERLSGAFDYPNTYAVFLLAGLIIQGTKNDPKPIDLLIDTILIFGVIISGSRTAFLLLILSLGYIGVVRRNIPLILSRLCAVAICMISAWLISSLDLLHNADRYTTISINAGTFLARLLYYKDALGMIIRHPFGIGYWGYRAMEGSFQTGRYYVTFVHNGFLQLLLDVGWIPALLLTGAFLKTLFCKSTTPTARGILLIVLSHCLLDFDLQFNAIWFLLLCTFVGNNLSIFLVLNDTCH